VCILVSYALVNTDVQWFAFNQDIFIRINKLQQNKNKMKRKQATCANTHTSITELELKHNMIQDFDQHSSTHTANYTNNSVSVQQLNTETAPKQIPSYV